MLFKWPVAAGTNELSGLFNLLGQDQGQPGVPGPPQRPHLLQIMKVILRSLQFGNPLQSVDDDDDNGLHKGRAAHLCASIFYFF